MMMPISKIADYASAKKLAHKVLLSVNDPVLPIKVRPLIKSLNDNGVAVHTYDQYVAIEGMDYNVFLQKVKSKDGALRYLPDTNSYILLYNKNILQERKIWTIAHEMGHYYAKHEIKIYNYAIKHRISPEQIPNEILTALEQEANCFAKELLAPVCLLQVAMAYLGVTDFVGIYTILRSLFKLSKEASHNVATATVKLKYPCYSSDIYLKYKPAMENFSNIITDYNTFNALLRKYEREIDIIDYRRRGIRRISGVFRDWH